MSNPHESVEALITESRRLKSASEQNARAMASLLVGNLHLAGGTELKALKKELSRYNSPLLIRGYVTAFTLHGHFTGCMVSPDRCSASEKPVAVIDLSRREELWEWIYASMGYDIWSLDDTIRAEIDGILAALLGEGE